MHTDNFYRLKEKDDATKIKVVIYKTNLTNQKNNERRKKPTTFRKKQKSGRIND